MFYCEIIATSCHILNPEIVSHFLSRQYSLNQQFYLNYYEKFYLSERAGFGVYSVVRADFIVC